MAKSETSKNIVATGRRKSSIVRAFLSKGSGALSMNGKDFKEYLSIDYLQAKVLEPLKLTNTENQYDIQMNATGGGIKGQAEAARMAIARSLVADNPELRKPLKDAKFLTRDSRAVERKKTGLRKARKKEQYSKR